MQLTIRGIAVTIADTEVARIVDDHFSNPFARDYGVKARVAPSIDTKLLEDLRIGESWGGGVYAGLTLHDNTPMHLVLLDGEAESLTWAKAKDWANGLEDNAELPSRHDALVLWQNLRDKFQKSYYWTAAPVESAADYAWYQLFSSGFQFWVTVNGKCRARAVRRLPL